MRTVSFEVEGYNQPVDIFRDVRARLYDLEETAGAFHQSAQSTRRQPRFSGTFLGAFGPVHDT